MTDPELQKVVEEIADWLDRPEYSLGDKRRRDALEDLLLRAADVARRAADRKAVVQNFAMYGSVVAMCITLGPKLLEWLRLGLAQ